MGARAKTVLRRDDAAEGGIWGDDYETAFAIKGDGDTTAANRLIP